MRRFFPFLLLLALIVPIQAQNFTILDDEAEPSGYDVTAQIQKAPAELVLAQNEAGDGYRLQIQPGEIALFKKTSAQPLLLGKTVLKTPPDANLVAQRRGPRWRVIINERVVLEAEDDTWNTGKIGWVGGLKNPRVQPVESINWNDDFMRVAKEVALASAAHDPRTGVVIKSLQLSEEIWTPVKGKWATTGLTENPAAQVAQSANPFAFSPLAAGQNVALAGRPFWSDYSAEISVEPKGAREIGLLFYAQDANNFLGLFWNQNGPVLRGMVGGQVRVFDAAPDFGAFEANQWYRLKIEVAGGQIRSYIDDQEVCRARTGLFGRGEIGVWADNPTEKDSAAFDDAAVRSLSDFYDDFSSVVAGRWQTVTGKWNFYGAARPADEKGAFAVMGEKDWQDYTVAGDLLVPADGSVGLVMHHQAGKGAFLLRVTGSRAKLPYAGKVQIVKIVGGKTSVLGEKWVGKPLNGTRTRWVFSDQRGYLSASREGERLADAFDESLDGGRAGIYAQKGAGEAPQISNLAVEFPKIHTTWAKVPDLYEMEQQISASGGMGGWSTPAAFWVKSADSNTLWHKGEFWGDDDLRFLLPALEADKDVRLVFKTRGGPDVTLSFAAKDGVQAALQRGNQKLESAKIDSTAGLPVEVMRRGSFLIVRTGKPGEQKLALAARV